MRVSRDLTSVGGLVSIAHAANLAGDFDLMWSARKSLRKRHGIKIQFCDGYSPTVCDPSMNSSGQADAEVLLMTILGARISIGQKTLPVGQIIGIVLENLAERGDLEPQLAKCGLKIDRIAEGECRQFALGGHKCLVVAREAVEKHLLRGTAWEGLAIDRILLRIPGTIPSRRRVGGKRARVALIPRNVLAGYLDRVQDTSRPGAEGGGTHVGQVSGHPECSN